MAVAAIGAIRMAIPIRTSDVPPAYRYDAWRSIVCDTLGPLDFRSHPDVQLSGEIEAGRLGPVNVGRVQTSTPHSAHRTPGLIRRGGSELYRVVLAMSGNLRLGQRWPGRAAPTRRVRDLRLRPAVRAGRSPRMPPRASPTRPRPSAVRRSESRNLVVCRCSSPNGRLSTNCRMS